MRSRGEKAGENALAGPRKMGMRIQTTDRVFLALQAKAACYLEKYHYKQQYPLMKVALATSLHILWKSHGFVTEG